ncbi:MAG: hypothetical protein QMD05_01600, partial [Candidatus Brocadiaceae bacterium]|nr:hypothetical protein [Candidatus Brocadiaceae bacterium]
MPHRTSTTHNRPFKVIGLMSGTSTDGISACLVEIHPPSPKNRRRVGASAPSLRSRAGSGGHVPLHVEVLSHETYPYEPSLRDNILEIIHPSAG